MTPERSTAAAHRRPLGTSDRSDSARTRVRRDLVLAATALALVTGLGAGAAGAQVDVESRPIATASVDHVGAPVGEVVNVRGSGWPTQTLVLVELCGNDGAAGSSDCNQPGSITTPVDADGVVSTPFTVPAPPVPCPCVIRLTTTDTATSVSVPLALDGVELVPGARGTGASSIIRRLDISGVTLSGGSITEALGGPAERTLTLTVTNAGTVAVTDPPLNVVAGPGDDPTGFVDPVAIGAIAPGESRTVEIPIDLGSFANGTYTVEGEIIGFEQPVTFSTTTSSLPWLLGVVVAAALAGIAALVVVHVRRRQHHAAASRPGGADRSPTTSGRRSPDPSADDATDAGPDTDTDTDTDTDAAIGSNGSTGHRRRRAAAGTGA